MSNATHFGMGRDGPPVLIAHGLFGSARNWGTVARRLSDRRHVICVDMRNHGDSPWRDTHTYLDMADDLARDIAAHGSAADIIGHSMGGKAAMVLALSHPARVRRLVVADIAPAAYAHTQAHAIRAMRALDLAGIDTRRAADAALAAAVPEAGLRAFLLHSLDARAGRWRLNLDALERHMPDIMGFPEISSAFEGDTLFLSGAASDYVTPAHRAGIKALFPKAKFAKIPGAGHWLHADEPQAFAAAAGTFLGGA